MPRYDYLCEGCGKVKEVRHGATETPLITCDRGKCNWRIMVKQLGTFSGFTFKGTGFYATDYKRKT